MLRLLIQRACGKSQIPRVLRTSSIFTQLRTYSSEQTSDKPVLKSTPTSTSTSKSKSKSKSNPYPDPEVTFDKIDDYSSYKATLFTHRLPESSARQCPPLVALHRRLNLPKAFSLSTLSQCLNMISKPEETDGLACNYGLQILGKSLLTYYVTEYLAVTYPRLPIAIHNAAVDSLIGTPTLLEIARSWGIEVDEVSKLDRFLGRESEFMKYGRLRYLSSDEKADNFYNKGNAKVEGIQEVVNKEGTITQEDRAYSSVCAAVVGGLYTHSGETVAKNFIKDIFLSRKIPLDQMFEIRQPTVELVKLCDKLEFKEGLSIRLMAETGRLSATPQFLAGVFVGEQKIGEGLGGSLKEAETRAAVNALLSYYLYSPINEQGQPITVPSDENYKFEGIIGIGDIGI